MSGQLNQLNTEVQVMPNFSISPWYADIVYVLQNLQPHAGLSKTRVRFVSFKAVNSVS